MDIRRTVLWMIFSFSLLLLWNNWQIHNGKPSLFGPTPAATTSEPQASANNATPSVPSTPAPAA
ncbi:membrane protein insertase YidC, partial [Achromobacter xylosoxidans]